MPSSSCNISYNYPITIHSWCMAQQLYVHGSSYQNKTCHWGLCPYVWGKGPQGPWVWRGPHRPGRASPHQNPGRWTGGRGTRWRRCQRCLSWIAEGHMEICYCFKTLYCVFTLILQMSSSKMLKAQRHLTFRHDLSRYPFHTCRIYALLKQTSQTSPCLSPKLTQGGKPTELEIYSRQDVHRYQLNF